MRGLGAILLILWTVEVSVGNGEVEPHYSPLDTDDECKLVLLGNVEVALLLCYPTEADLLTFAVTVFLNV